MSPANPSCEMKIAHVAPLFESVPPKAYGGTERILAYIADEMIEQGHDLTVFASSDSQTRAKLQHIGVPSLRENLGYDHWLGHHYRLFEKVRFLANEFDVLHFHTDYFHYPFFCNVPTPQVTTIHSRVDNLAAAHIFRMYPHLPLTSISFAQRQTCPNAPWLANIYHGLPRHLYHCGAGDGGYLAFLGRASPEKGILQAIEISCRARIPLRIAAKIDISERGFFENQIVGEINESQKQDFLGRAIALLFPINWPEPFGLVMIEAMACGTPVVAYNHGSVPEIIDDSVTGFVVRTLTEALEAIKRLHQIKRRECRRQFEKRFNIKDVAREYLSLYEDLVDSRWKMSSSTAISSM